MKNGKKFLLLALALVMVASLLIAASGRGTSKRIEQGDTETVGLGRAGVAFTDSYYTGTVFLKRSGRTAVPQWMIPSGRTFTQDLLDVTFYDQNWTKIKVVTGAVYVYFKLSNPERNAFDDGLLHIYYFDTWKNSWKVCPTYLTNGGARAACRIRNFGKYGLAYGVP